MGRDGVLLIQEHLVDGTKSAKPRVRWRTEQDYVVAFATSVFDEPPIPLPITRERLSQGHSPLSTIGRGRAVMEAMRERVCAASARFDSRRHQFGSQDVIEVDGPVGADRIENRELTLGDELLVL